jgi:hypothetical protein
MFKQAFRQATVDRLQRTVVFPAQAGILKRTLVAIVVRLLPRKSGQAVGGKSLLASDISDDDSRKISPPKESLWNTRVEMTILRDHLVLLLCK